VSRPNWLPWAVSPVTHTCGFKSLVPTGHLVLLTAESTSEESSRQEAIGLHQAVTEAAIELTEAPPSSIMKPPSAIISSLPVNVAVVTAASPEPAAHCTRSHLVGHRSLDVLGVRRPPPSTLTITTLTVEPVAKPRRSPSNPR
jgi:hypothetical protein